MTDINMLDAKMSNNKIHKKADKKRFPKKSFMTNLGWQRRNSDIKKTPHINSRIFKKKKEKWKEKNQNNATRNL